MKQKINQLKTGATLTYVSMGIGYLISIIYTPIMLRLLGQSEYGLYNLIASIIAYLGILNFGFGSAYIRYYSKYRADTEKENLAKLNGMFFLIFIFIGLISVLAGMVLVQNLELIVGSKITAAEIQKAKILMIIMIANIAISFPGIIFTSYITANEKFIFQKLLHIIRIVVNPFLLLPVLLMGYGSVGLVVISTFLNIVMHIANLVYCKHKLKIQFSFKKFNFSVLKEVSIFSSFIFMSMIIDQINWNVDKLILGRFHGTVSVAIYGLASQLSIYYVSFSSAISNVFIPRVHKMVSLNAGKEELTNLFTKVGRIQFIILSLIFTGLCFFGNPFINLWVGKDYANSYPILILLILPITVPLIQSIGIEIQRAKNMHKFRSYTYLAIAIINIIITIPLAKAYGGVGAAAGTAVSFVVGNGIVMNWYYHKKIGLDIKYFWKQILKFIPSLLPPILLGIVLNIFFNLNSIILFLLLGTVYVVVFSISMWVFGMNQYEKNLLEKPIRKIIKKIKLYR